MMGWRVESGGRQWRCREQQSDGEQLKTVRRLARASVLSPELDIVLYCIVLCCVVLGRGGKECVGKGKKKRRTRGTSDCGG